MVGSQVCGPQVCVPIFFFVRLQPNYTYNRRNMNRAFVYGMSVEGENTSKRAKYKINCLFLLPRTSKNTKSTKTFL